METYVKNCVRLFILLFLRSVLCTRETLINPYRRIEVASFLCDVLTFYFSHLVHVFQMRVSVGSWRQKM